MQTNVKPLSHLANAQLPHCSNPADLLDLKQVADQLGVAYGRLRGFTDIPQIQTYIGAMSVPGAKGLRYPQSAIALLRPILTAQDEGLVTPKTAAAWIQQNTLLQPSAGGNAPLQQSGNGALPPQSLALARFDPEVMGILTDIRDYMARQEIMARVQEELLQGHIQPPEDRLITAEEAASMLACNRRAVSRYVKPVRPGAWKRSMILRYILSLG